MISEGLMVISDPYSMIIISGILVALLGLINWGLTRMIMECQEIVNEGILACSRLGVAVMISGLLISGIGVMMVIISQSSR
jgi:hypothetical protein